MSRSRSHVHLEVKIKGRIESRSTRLALPLRLYCFESLAMFPFVSTFFHKSEVPRAHSHSLCFCGRSSLRHLYKLERLILCRDMGVGGTPWSPCDVQSRSLYLAAWSHAGDRAQCILLCSDCSVYSGQDTALTADLPLPFCCSVCLLDRASDERERMRLSVVFWVLVSENKFLAPFRCLPEYDFRSYVTYSDF